MKVTFLTGHLAKERHSLLFELAEDLSANGAKVTVVTGFPSRRISSEVRDYYLKHPIETINENFVIKRVGSKKGEGKGLFDRFIKYLFLCRSIKKEALKLDTDCFYIYSSPPFLGYHIKCLKKKAPVVYNAQDIFPDSLFAIKPKLSKTLFGAFLRRKERAVYNNSSSIITISEAMKSTIKSRCEAGKQIDVVYNWSDYNSMTKVSKVDNHLFEDFGIPRDKFIVSYGGDIGLFQNWDIILKAANIIQTDKRILFVIFGNGSRLDYINNLIKDNKITNVMVLPMQPKSRVSEVYSLGDLELVSLSSGLTSFALPSKLYNIFACKKPVLAMIDKNSEYFELIKKNTMGYSVEPNDYKGLINSILSAIEDDKLKLMGDAGFNYLVENCSRHSQTKKYYDILKYQTLKK